MNCIDKKNTHLISSLQAHQPLVVQERCITIKQNGVYHKENAIETTLLWMMSY